MTPEILRRYINALSALLAGEDIQAKGKMTGTWTNGDMGGKFSLSNIPSFKNWLDFRVDGTKPCPFCGFQPHSQDPDFCYPVGRLMEDGSQVWSAHCYESGGGCGAQTTGWTRGEAVSNWNRRAQK